VTRAGDPSRPPLLIQEVPLLIQEFEEDQDAAPAESGGATVATVDFGLVLS
jgi:hypothetical protein